jgi:hypothetical protein
MSTLLLDSEFLISSPSLDGMLTIQPVHTIACEDWSNPPHQVGLHMAQ